MMRKQFIILVLALLPLCLTVQGQETDAPKEKKSSGKIFTGFSGGMLLHGGYLFAKDPKQVFSNTASASSIESQVSATQAWVIRST